MFGKPVALFADDYDFGAGTSIANYDVTADGRFIMIRRGVNGGKLRVVINWTDELKQILASGIFATGSYSTAPRSRSRVTVLL